MASNQLNNVFDSTLLTLTFVVQIDAEILVEGEIDADFLPLLLFAQNLALVFDLGPGNGLLQGGDLELVLGLELLLQNAVQVLLFGLQDVVDCGAFREVGVFADV